MAIQQLINMFASSINISPTESLKLHQKRQATEALIDLPS